MGLPTACILTARGKSALSKEPAAGRGITEEIELEGGAVVVASAVATPAGRPTPAITEVAAGVEGLLPDAADSGAKENETQVRALPKCPVTDRSHRVGNGHPGQPRAVSKAVGADASHAGRNRKVPHPASGILQQGLEGRVKKHSLHAAVERIVRGDINAGQA